MYMYIYTVSYGSSDLYIIIILIIRVVVLFFKLLLPIKSFFFNFGSDVACSLQSNWSPHTVQKQIQKTSIQRLFWP